MIGQRVLAALLTVLFLAFVIAVAVAVFRALGHPAYGWFVGIGFDVVMIVAFAVSRQRERS